MFYLTFLFFGKVKRDVTIVFEYKYFEIFLMYTTEPKKSIDMRLLTLKSYISERIHISYFK